MNNVLPIASSERTLVCRRIKRMIAISYIGHFDPSFLVFFHPPSLFSIPPFLFHSKNTTLLHKLIVLSQLTAHSLFLYPPPTNVGENGVPSVTGHILSAGFSR